MTPQEELDEEKIFKLSEKIYYLSVEFERSDRQVTEGRTEIFAEIAYAISQAILSTGFVKKEELYPCADCGKLRTKDEGGTTFTVCDKCWDKHYKKVKKDKGVVK